MMHKIGRVIIRIVINENYMIYTSYSSITADIANYSQILPSQESAHDLYQSFLSINLI